MFVCMKAWSWKNVEDNLALSFCFLLESLIFAILLDLDTPWTILLQHVIF